MFLADKGVTGIPKRWQHNPDLLSSHKLTVAGYYARNDIIPPEEWKHDPSMKLTNNKTVAMILVENGEKDIN